MIQPHWKVRLGIEAEKDFARILKYTKENFGPGQADIYKITLIEALASLYAGPELPGSAAREEILPRLRSLHVARAGRRGRHFIMYRTANEQTIEVVRILHDAMDFARHIPQDFD